MTRTLALGLALALLVCSGCKRKPVPSPQFAEAEGIYSQLVSYRGEAAWLDPDMDRVYTLCNSVNEKSSDYQAARAMMAKIDGERAKLKNLKSNFAPPNSGDNAAAQPEFLKPLKTNDGTDNAAAADADAGPAEIAGFEVGSDFAKISARYGPCFAPTAAQVQTQDGMADGYTWAGRTDCPRQLQVVADKLILVRNGKIAMVVDKSRMITRTFEVDADGGSKQVGGPPPDAPDAGAAAAAPGTGPR
ncbi:MAG: hypothetical protein QM723_05375 [Myxococcaceae bacterium]